MANTAAISRLRLVYGLCMPLAVLLGFFLADPHQQSTVAVVGMVLAVLCAPLLIKWHHPLLILSWNASVAPAFLPGNPSLWMLLAVPALILALAARSTDANRRFVAPAVIIWPLAVLLGIVVLTAMLTGGVGLQALGSQQFGGKAYFYIALAVVGFLALISCGIPSERSGLYTAMFFLPGLTALMGNLIYLAGPKAYGLFDFFPATWAIGQAVATERVGAQAGSARIGGFTEASVLFLCFLLARHGMRGLFDLTRPWRLCLLVAAFVGVLYAGYRSALILFGLVVVLVFLLEGLHRTRLLAGALLAACLLGVVVLEFLPSMPYVVQRSLAFLPVRVDPSVRADVQDSTRWRVEMWRDVISEVPQYLLVGKGYGINPRELDVAIQGRGRGQMPLWSVAAVAGNYHNGPLSVLMPLGGAGLLAFLWLLLAGFRVLHRHCRHGDPQLRFINQLLLGYYLARVILFLAVFGCFHSDLAVFLGLIGFGLCLNATLWHQPTLVAGREQLPQLQQSDLGQLPMNTSP